MPVNERLLEQYQEFVGENQEVIWAPQPGPQSAMIECPVFEVFFGGARGGGKTEAALGDWIQHSGLYGEAAIGVFFRKTFTQLSEVIARSQQLFGKLGAKWRGDVATWTMPGGARLLFRHLERDSDADNYQGHNYTRNYFEELTNHPTSGPYNKLKATLRSASGVPTGIRSTGNPGGPGHGWVKHRFIDPDPAGYKVIREPYRNPFTNETVYLDRVFIPSRLIDNRLLMVNDPLYVAKLQEAGSARLVKAWLLGDWNFIDGAFFDEFDPEVHIIPHSMLSTFPSHLTCFRAMDWGFAKPFSIGWYVVSDGTFGFPNKAIIKVSEWYGCTGKPNVGLRMNADAVGAGIMKRDKLLADDYGWRVVYGVIDPAAWTQDGGPAIAETMAVEGAHFLRADNKRDAGWMQLRRGLRGAPAADGGTDGRPLLYFSELCHDTIRTLPLLQHDEHKVEDLDTDGEDHAADETRYACMSRPWVAAAPPPEEDPELRMKPVGYTFNQILEMNRKRRLAAAGGGR